MSTGLDPTIILSKDDGWWVAKDAETGAASQDQSREEALENLDEAVELFKSEIGESIDTPEEERAALRDLGLDPDEIEAASEENSELPEFMQWRPNADDYFFWPRRRKSADQEPVSAR